MGTRFYFLRIVLTVAMLAASISKASPPQLSGYLVTDVASVDAALADGHNAIAYIPRSVQDIHAIFAAVDNRATVVLELGSFLWDAERGVFARPVPEDVKHALAGKHFILHLDEPLWHTRQACWNGKPEACAEVDRGYTYTIQRFADLKFELNALVLWVEAYAELILQQLHQFGYVINVTAADYIAFNCYGALTACGDTQFGYYGVFEYFHWLMLSRQPHQRAFLVAGTFTTADGTFFASEQEMLDTLTVMVDVYNTHREWISGLGFFLYDSVDVFTGADQHPEAREIAKGAIRHGN